MRMLITGGAGFIGSAVVALARDRGHDVRVLDSLRPDVHGRHPAGTDDDLVVADVRDPGAVRRAVHGTDAVVHLAAKVGLDTGLGDLDDYVSSNDLGTAVLLRTMGAGVGRLVLAGSMVVYGEGAYSCPADGRVRPAPRAPDDLDAGRFEPNCPRCGRELRPELVGEDEQLDPRNAYAATKLHQEHLSAVWARLSGGSAVALRFHNVYGPGMPRDTPYAGVAAIFRSALLAGRAPRVLEDGGQRRDFVHVRDVAAAVLRAAEVERPGGSLRAYNVGSGRITTVGELARIMAEALGGPAPQVVGGYRLGDVRHITASSARAERELGWRARTEPAEGLRELATLPTAVG